MEITIEQTILDDEIKNFIFDGFKQHAREMVGYNGFADHQIVYLALKNDKRVGAITILPFWGALHIQYLYIDKEYRKQGIGHQLIDKALEFAKNQNLKSVYVETLSFQALEYYLKLDFTLEFTRTHYTHGVSFHYLHKELS